MKMERIKNSSAHIAAEILKSIQIPALIFYLLKKLVHTQMIKSYLVLISIIIPCIFAQSCIQCKPGKCSSIGCTACNDDFMLNTIGQCGLYTPVEGCIKYNAFSAQCSECESTRILIDSRCFSKPDYCDITDRNRQCLRCIGGYTLVRGKCYTIDLKQCPLGTLPSITGIPNSTIKFCQPIRPANCKKFDDQKICISCEDNYSLANGRCLRFSPKQYPCLKNQCNCPPGFFPLNQKCLQLQIDKCTLIRSDGIYCSACIRGFVAIQGVCLQTVKQDDINCNVLAPNSDYCTGCNQDYFLNEDALCARDFNYNYTSCPLATGYFTLQRNQRCVYRDPRCDALNYDNYNCIRCQEGFELKDNVCQRIVCIGYLQNGTCNQVFIGYAISSNSIVRLPANCLALQPGTFDVCAQCSQFTRSFPLNSLPSRESICVYYDQFCAQYNRNGNCIRCMNEGERYGYVLIQRFCYKKAEFCFTPDPNDASRCQKCSPGYHQDPNDRRCYIDIEGCEYYQSGSKCKQCSDAYLLYDRKCISATTQCLDFDANNICRRCQNGLLPFKSTCVYFHPYCSEYGADKICKTPASGWTTGNGMNEDQKRYYRQFIMRGQNIKASNSAVNLAGLTTNLGAGSYNNGGIISSMPYANLLHSKINSVNMYGQISNCQQGFTKINNFCISISKVISNCSLYNQNQFCLRCEPGFTLNSDFTCSNGLLCQQPSSNGRCKTCAVGSIDVGEGQCFRVDNKNSIDNLVKNTFIYFKYELTNGIYVTWPRSTLCLNQTEPFKCNQCFPQYTLDNGECKILVPNCNNYGANTMTPGVCQACQNGYRIWFGQCQSYGCVQPLNGLCPSCPVNNYYYFGICLNNLQQNCKMLNNNTCVLCAQRFYLNTQNQCAQEVAGCLTTNRDTGRCSECRANKILYKDICVNEIKYCQDYDTRNICTRCLQNSVNRTQLMMDGTCGLLEGQCNKIDEKTRACIGCNFGYTLITQDKKDICVLRRQKCKTYDIRGRCVVCDLKFVLQNNQCKRFVPDCIKYNNTECVQCSNNTILKNGCCQRSDPNCKDYNYIGCFCDKCFDKYFFTERGRCQNNPPGCEVYNDTSRRCIKCLPSYQLQPDGICSDQSSLIVGCEIPSKIIVNSIEKFKCLKCVKGFQLNQTDFLCYAYNCKQRDSRRRFCLNCPPLHKLYTPNFQKATQVYCIPQFCTDYIPRDPKCAGSSSIEFQSYTINIQTTTITFTWCTSFNVLTSKCQSCQNLRYPSSKPYGLCYPLNCNSTQQFNCQNCQFGFTSHPTFRGACAPQYCLQIDNRSGKCQNCMKEYFKNNGICENRGCCEQYSNSSCMRAKKYFTLENKICIVGNCQVTKSLTACSICYQGYQLLDDGTCRAKFCKTQSYFGQKCFLCNPGYKNLPVPNTMRSICRPNYCEKISDDGKTCLKCIQGFKLNFNNLCVANFCSKFNDSLVCIGCQSYYKLQDQRCIADCLIGTNTVCQCCSYGSTLNATSGLCQLSQNYCMKTNSADMCVTCLPGYDVVYGKCVWKTPNCKNLAPLGCSKCLPGYQLVSNCFCRVKNCLNYNENGTCLACHPRFQLTDDKVCKPRDCKSFNFQIWACNGCYSRFIFQDGVCVASNCSEWQDLSRTICKKCAQFTYTSMVSTFFDQVMSFDLINGGCYTKYCLNDPREIYCTTCKPGYSLTTIQTCQCTQIINQVTKECKCPSGYIWDKTKEQCIENRDVCLLRDESLGICLKCPVQYQFPTQNNGQCIPLYCSSWLNPYPHYFECATCYPFFDLKGLFCKSNLCTDYKSDKNFVLPQCTKCLNNWVPYDNYCIPRHCQPSSYSLKNGTCTQCKDFGFELKDGICVFSNCLIPKLPDDCQKCNYGYVLSNNLCLARNCSAFNGTTCGLCLKQFEFKNNICLSRNCDQFDQQFICKKCSQGYTLNLATLYCTRINCIDDTPKQCLKCIRGYKFDAFLNRCIQANCQVYDKDYNCQKCLKGYLKQNGTCLDARCDPDSYDSSWNCKKCAPGYSFNKSQLCYPSQPGFCPPGKYFQDSTCLPIPIDFCLIFIRKNCFLCADGYFQWGGLCYSTQYCTRYSYFLGCFECVARFELRDRQCKLQSTDINCIEYNFDQCIRCKEGYLPYMGKCISVTPNCIELDGNGNCSRCNPTYTLKGGNCQFKDPNCVNFDNLGNCKQCSNNYFLNSQGLCQILPVNCVTADPSGQCTQCILGFSLQNGKCYKLVPYCKNYFDVNTFCSQCLDTFTMVGNQCRCLPGNQIIKQKCVQLPQNCVRMVQTTLICDICAPNYKLVSNVCQPNKTLIQNCNIYDPQTGFCKQCFSNYILANNFCQLCPADTMQIANQCINKIPYCAQYARDYRTCLRCDKNYITSNGRCTPLIISQNCVEYDPKTGKCIRCYQGYNLTNNICQKIQQISISNCQQVNQMTALCVRCQTGYLLTPDQKLCIYILNCISSNNFGLCTQCLSGYSLTPDSRLCVLISNCTSFNNFGLCTQCVSGYLLTPDQKLCVYIPNCMACNNSGFCVQCLSGYTLTPNARLCVYIANCLSYNNFGLCTGCIDGYTPSNNGSACLFNKPPTPLPLPIIPYCFSQGGSCLRCQHRYYLASSQRCSAYIRYCINIDLLGRCISCCFGSSLINGTCQKDSVIKFCDRQVGNTCQKCSNNYTYCQFCDVCLPNSPNCLQYNSDGDCQKCIENFVLLNGICISPQVGEVSGVSGTCRPDYYLKNGNCYRNMNSLRLFSSQSPNLMLATAPPRNIAAAAASVSEAYVINSNDILIIFGIVLTTNQPLSQNASFLLYYRSKIYDPLVCWNSCIPTKIEGQNYTRELTQPIIAVQVQVYLINQSRQSMSIDFRIL